MAVKVNPVEAAVYAAKRGQRMAAQGKPNDDVIRKAEIQTCFKTKKFSVIPPKRRLVKRMMFDLLVKFVASLCSSEASTSDETHLSNTQKCNDPFP